MISLAAATTPARVMSPLRGGLLEDLLGDVALGPGDDVVVGDTGARRAASRASPLDDLGHARARRPVFHSCVYVEWRTVLVERPAARSVPSSWKLYVGALPDHCAVQPWATAPPMISASVVGLTVAHTMSGLALTSSVITGVWSDAGHHGALAVVHDFEPEGLGGDLGAVRAVLAVLAGEGDDGHGLAPFSSDRYVTPFIDSTQ